ncbi:MAG: hypothetical protein A3K54_00100 [Omnitrophica WOR_2 bacterium RBG_13_44_8]|nr:MAG: hypothetical protein A3K54_00100 [Omnitrophica WOR_2 bacterium RBG_13_44_8]
MSTEKQTLRVAAQLTFHGTVSLIAEESLPPFNRGDVVKRVSRLTLSKMDKPLNVLITSRGG